MTVSLANISKGKPKGFYREEQIRLESDLEVEQLFPFFLAVLICRSCCNKVPQICYFKTVEIYSLIVQEAGSPKSRCWQGGFLLEAPRQNLIPAPLLALRGGWQSWTFLGL